ncbi:hypothetical protein ACFVWT_18435 [Arthrobacter sp. NPDC058288]|uniref:hypothetical protein n=1 Tax=Arthrobacter sp. NPDC058288 TaxID=3346424 RepID=UPI0036E56D78
MPVYLKNLSKRLDSQFISDDDAFERFQVLADIAALNWPKGVVRQWLWDHGFNDSFLRDYGSLDIYLITWTLEKVPANHFLVMETGASDGDCIEEYAANHGYWMGLKSRPHPAVRKAWEEEGTWLVPPIALERRLLEPSDIGLQLVEGRTRVGILRGRLRAGLQVAGEHETWVGRRNPSTA